MLVTICDVCNEAFRWVGSLDIRYPIAHGSSVTIKGSIEIELSVPNGRNEWPYTNTVKGHLCPDCFTGILREAAKPVVNPLP